MRWIFAAIAIALIIVLTNTPTEWNTEINPVIAEWARHNTPQDAIFIVPPHWGQFRILASRAIVVDWKAFPFADLSMLEWRTRIETVYGNGNTYETLDESYQRRTTQELIEIALLYDAQYAIVRDNISLELPTIFSNGDYQIVEIIPDT
jgi:hypothetical protein